MKLIFEDFFGHFGFQEMYEMKYNIQVNEDMHLCAGPIMSGGKGTCIVSSIFQNLLDLSVIPSIILNSVLFAAASKQGRLLNEGGFYMNCNKISRKNDKSLKENFVKVTLLL